MVLTRGNAPPRGCIDAHGVAAIAGLSAWRIQELDRQRRIAETLLESGTAQQQVAARKYLRAEALPAPVRLSPRPRVWNERAVRAWAARTERVVDGRPVRKSPPGRTPGGPPPIPRKRPLLPDRLAAFDDVDVPGELLGVLRLLLDRLYARLRARGLATDEAREEAAQLAAKQLGCAVDQARKVVLMVAVGRRRPTPEQLAHIVVPAGAVPALLPALQAAVGRWRAQGATVGEARAGAVEQVAAEHGADQQVVWKVLLEAVYALT